MPGQVGADPVRELLLNGPCVQCLGLFAGYKADPAFTRPMVSFSGYPASLFAHHADQVPGRMQSGIQLATLGIDANLYRAKGNGLREVMHDAVVFL